MSVLKLDGMVPAAVMPMTANLEPDYEAFARYLEWLIKEGAVALAVNMDTGEGPQLSPLERERAVTTAVEVSAGRCGVLAGIMGATTPDAISNARAAQEAGADGLVVFPNPSFRNAPLDPRIPFEYHQAIAEAARLPLVLFQLAPVFGGVIYSRNVLEALLAIEEVVGVKEASFDAEQFARTAQQVAAIGRTVTILTGNDRFIGESILLGATGALLGFGAIGCRLVAELLDCAARQDYEAFASQRKRVQRFADVIYREPVLDYRARCKAALAHIGIFERVQTFVRLPLLPLDEAEYQMVSQATDEAGIAKVFQPAD